MVRAKFKCESKTFTEAGVRVQLSPVYDGSPENEKFYHYTPSGHLDMGILNPEAAAQFEPGREFYIDFTPAE